MSLSGPQPLRPRHCGLKPTPRQKRRGFPVLCHQKLLVTTKNGSMASAGKRLAPVSEGLQRISTKLTGGTLGVLLSDLPAPTVKRATAAAADAALGRSASPSLRLLVRRILRAAVALSSLATFALRVRGGMELLAQLAQHLEALLGDLSTDLELVSTVDSLLGPVVPPALPLRATIAAASIAMFLVKLRSTTDTIAHLDFEHGVLAGVMSVLDLATSGPSLMENCRELMQIGVAVGPAAAWGAGLQEGKTDPGAEGRRVEDDDLGRGTEEDGEEDDE